MSSTNKNNRHKNITFDNGKRLNQSRMVRELARERVGIVPAAKVFIPDKNKKEGKVNYLTLAATENADQYAEYFEDDEYYSDRIDNDWDYDNWND
jgi:hypothetical protein